MLQAIQDRRSIRKYKQDEVPVSAIEEVLRAGMLAPSSKTGSPGGLLWQRAGRRTLS